jgi:SAM-dependent methyltransferase
MSFVCIQRLVDALMRCRAERLVARLKPHLRRGERIADVGSGTGHNAEALRQRLGVAVVEFDVDDLHWVGPGPTLLPGERIPAEPRAFDVTLLLFVLQYPAEVRPLLTEAARITRRRLIVVQSAVRGRWGRLVLAIRGFCWGRCALQLARWCRLVAAPNATMRPRRAYTREQLRSDLEATGWRIIHVEPAAWPGLGVSRELFVLEPPP